MMKKIFKWFAIVVGSLVGLFVLVIVTTNVMANTRMNRLYDVNTPVVPIPDDEAALERGKHLVEVVSQCSGCHGPDLGGELFMDDPMVGVIPAPNLTSGQGGVGAYYTDVDWTRALVHGVAPDGRMLLVMPSQHFRHYSDEDLGAVIAYLKHASPVARSIESRRLALVGNTMFGLGLFGTMPAEIIDHLSARPQAPQPGESAE
jgi:mono/diheme cytochrome c family protein